VEEELRKRLGEARNRLAVLDRERDSLVKEISELRSKITPRKERCQICGGSGKLPRRDVWSGWDYMADCENCGGSGLWSEPV
jgi:DnaJ-class molecular chaperone